MCAVLQVLWHTNVSVHSFAGHHVSSKETKSRKFQKERSVLKNTIVKESDASDQTSVRFNSNALLDTICHVCLLSHFAEGTKFLVTSFAERIVFQEPEFRGLGEKKYAMTKLEEYENSIPKGLKLTELALRYGWEGDEFYQVHGSVTKFLVV